MVGRGGLLVNKISLWSGLVNAARLANLLLTFMPSEFRISITDIKEQARKGGIWMFIADRKRRRPQTVGIKAQPAPERKPKTEPVRDGDRTVDLGPEMQKAKTIDELRSPVSVIDRNSVSWTDAARLLIVRFAEWAGWLTSVEEGVVQAYLRSHTVSKF